MRCIYIKRQSGEFLLSRELQNISAEHDAQAVIVGTCAQGRKSLFVTAKVIDAATSNVIA
jgi:TolB-like protein